MYLKRYRNASYILNESNIPEKLMLDSIYNEILVSYDFYDTSLIVELTFNNLKENEILKKLIFKMKEFDRTISNADTYDLCKVDGYHQNYTFTTLFAGLKVDYELIDEEVVGILTIDLSSLGNELTSINNKIRFAVDVKQAFNYAKHEQNNSFSYEAEFVNKQDVNNSTKFDAYQIDNNSNILVKRQDGKSYYNINLVSTITKKNPVNISLIGGKSLTINRNILSQPVAYNFDLYFTKEDNVIYKMNALGTLDRYYLVVINEEDEVNVRYKDLINIKESKPLYYNDKDGSYIYDYSSGSIVKYKLFDKYSNYFIYQKNGNYFNLIETSNTQGRKTFYSWDNHKLVEVTNSDDTSVIEIEYNSEGILEFASESVTKMNVEITDTSSLLTLKYINGNSYIDPSDNTNYTHTDLYELKYQFNTSGYLTQVDETLSDKRLVLTYLNNQISKVETKYKGTSTVTGGGSLVVPTSVNVDTNDTLAPTITTYKSLDIVKYEYTSEYTKITTFDNKIFYSYFDDLDRLIIELNDEGKFTNYNYYGNTENLESNAVTLDGKERFVKNSSFELENDGSLKDWTIPETQVQGTWKLEDEGMYGKCLKITREGSSIFYLEQEIKDKFGPVDFIKGYYKFSNTDTSSTINVSLTGTYLLNGVETSVDKEITLSYKSKWTLFTLDEIEIPKNAIFNGRLLFSISGNTTNDIYLDDIQFGDRITNFNLIKNGEMDSLDNWNISFTSPNDTANIIYTNEQELEYCLGKKMLKLSLANLSSVSQVIKYSGKPGDQFLLSTFVLFNYILYNRNNVVIELGKEYEDDTLGLTFETYESFKFDFDVIDKWNVLSKTIVATKSFTHIKINFNFEGNGFVFLDSIKLLNTYKNNQFYYDEKNNIVEVVNSNQSITKINYSQLNKVSYLSNGDVSYTFIYDECGNLIEAIDSNGLKMEFMYNEYDDVVKKTIRYGDGELLSTISEYDVRGNEVEYADEFRKTFTRTFDNLNRITSETLPNNVTYFYKYTPFNELEKMSISSNYNLIKYEDGHKLKELSSSGGEKYLYEYDEMDNLIKVSTINGLVLAEFEYEKEVRNINTGLVTKKTYPVGGSYNFEYDDKYRLKSIYYGSSLKYTYEYDENDNLSKIINNDETKYFIYDKLNNLVAIKSSKNNEIHYIYDNLNNVCKKNYVINNDFKSVEYKHTYNNKLLSFDRYVQKYLNKTNHDILLGGKAGYGTSGLKAIESTLDFNDFISDDGNKVFKFTKKNHSFKLNMSDVNKNLLSCTYINANFNKEKFIEDFSKNQMIEFWIKPKESFSNTELIKFYGIINGQETLSNVLLFNNLGELIFYEYEDNQVKATKETGVKLNINKWNYISLSILSSSFDELHDNVCKIYYNFNRNDYLEENFIKSKYHIKTIQFGKLSEDVDNLLTPYDISMISIGQINNDVLSTSWYVEGLKALNNAKLEIKDETVFVNQDLSNSFEIYSLEGDIYSSRNNKMNLEHNINYLPFEYDKGIDKLVYSSYKYKESYLYLEPRISNIGVISFDFKVDSYNEYSSLSTDDKNEVFTLNERYIFSSSRMNLFIANSRLYIEINGNVSSLVQFVDYDVWNKFTLILCPGTNLCSLYLNDELIYSLSNFSLNNDVLFLGSKFKLEVNHLDGCFKNLLISNKAYNTAAKQYNLVELLLNHSNKFVENKYNQLNMLTNKNVCGVYRTNYTYDKTKLTNETSDYFSNNYTFNDIGNLVYLTTNGVNGSSSHQYGYDIYNRLRSVINSSQNKQEQITINYDNNGNIRNRVVINTTNGTAVESTFTYDSRNRLIGMNNGINRYVLQYGNTSLNPSKIIKNNEIYNIYYEGKRIVGINNNQYLYNEEGNRTRKVIVNDTSNTAEVHDYILEGNKIIKETVYGDSRNYEIYFNYDMHKQLIGFEYENNTYFYVRDALGNINHIIDQNENLMLSYEYDEWGKLINTITTSNFALVLSSVNPFIYKGYYYDVETGLFMMGHRYYSPELCRFIQPDDIEYLDPSSINGLNLYCYCFNNPIMYVDPTGHIPEWLSDVGRFVGGLLISAASIGLMVATISSGGLLCLLPGYGTLLQAELSLAMYGGFMMASSWDPLIQSDMEAINWNPFNSNPDMSKVNKVSFYKGEAVIIQDFAGASFSFGIMGLHINDKNDVNTVNHEWGHFAQLALHGPAMFTLFTALPSLIYNIYCRITGDWSKYYKMPWEAYADYLGGVKR